MNKFKLKLAKDKAVTLRQILILRIAFDPRDYEEAMHVALLLECLAKLEVKMADRTAQKVSLSLSPAQAIALALYFAELLTGMESVTDVSVFLLDIKNQIFKQFQIK